MNCLKLRMQIANTMWGSFWTNASVNWTKTTKKLFKIGNLCSPDSIFLDCVCFPVNRNIVVLLNPTCAPKCYTFNVNVMVSSCSLRRTFLNFCHLIVLWLLINIPNFCNLEKAQYYVSLHICVVSLSQISNAQNIYCTQLILQHLVSYLCNLNKSECFFCTFFFHFFHALSYETNRCFL